MASAQWVAWAGGRGYSGLCLFCSGIPGKSLNPVALFLEVSFLGERGGSMNRWRDEHRRFLG